MINQVDVAIGAKLRQLRTAAGMTTTRLAMQCGIALPHYEAGERGEQRFSARELHRLAKALDTPFSTLFVDYHVASVSRGKAVRLHRL